MISTTGTTIENYLGWAKNEIEKKQFGEVSLIFTITAGQVTYVQKGSIDKDQIPLKRKSENMTICGDGNEVHIINENEKAFIFPKEENIEKNKYYTNSQWEKRSKKC